MPPKAKKNTLILLTNIGSTSLEQNSLEEEPFIDKAKYAMKILVEKKIFLQPKDEIGVITMGDETDNPSEVDYVKLYCDHLLVPHWDIIKYINGLEATDNPCNWIEGLHVAVSFIDKEVLDPSCIVFLVIFHNFKEDADCIEEYDSEVIANQLKTYSNLHLLFVGEKSFDDLSVSPNPSEEFVLAILNQTSAQYEQLNSFVESRRFYVAPPTNPLAWKFGLEWAGFVIPCVEYLKTIESTSTSTPWKLSGGDSEDLLENSANLDSLITGKITSKTTVMKQNVALDHHRNQVLNDNIISGYQFGGKYIPFSEEDESASKFEGTEKGMMIYGFVPQDEVNVEFWAGEGSRIVVPASEEECVAFYSLVRAMVEKKYAAIVRKVYANNNLPKIGVFFPKIDDDDIYCLIHIELPFAEDVRYFDKVPITSIEDHVSTGKLEALDEFIDSMTIGDNEEAELDFFNPGMFPNVPNQYYYNAVADRALNPTGALLPVNDYLKRYLEIPEFLKNRVKPCIEKLDEAFEECKSILEVGIEKPSVTKKIEAEEEAVQKAVADKPIISAVPMDTNGTDKRLFAGNDSNAVNLVSETFEDF
ncbi:X-ray repair cross-complementing protein 5-like [Copidosoma floridanum]|uniref:X-ray repair cross-complementing protein 5-like n=1 Tax=Copidosoma floridanum TaxID=29053 RepID=UPI000C6F75F5|nr:X-ray repair cross-complementing protein 5-like [Copidosoma floridanum]